MFEIKLDDDWTKLVCSNLFAVMLLLLRMVSHDLITVESSSVQSLHHETEIGAVQPVDVDVLIF